MRPPKVSKLDSLPKRSATFLEPMECASVAKLPIGDQWAFEIKLDGYRAIAVKSGTKVGLLSRNHKSFNTQYKAIVEALAGMPEDSVIDGEIVALDSGPA